mgnify:CR=1 FL=1
MNLKRDTYAIVDLDHLKYNVELAHNEFKRPLMAVIKADAYGHGYKEVASFLKDIDYVEMFAVATLPEAIELRELGIDKGILILGAIPTSKKDIDLAIKYDISLTMVDEDIKVQISKQDITTKKELEGAKLKVTDKDGKVIDEWTSGNIQY